MAPARGAGEGPAVNPAPSPVLPWDLSHPGPGASRPPVGPSSRSLKARVVWEEFRHGGGRGKQLKRKKGKTDVHVGKQAEADSRFFIFLIFFHCHVLDGFNPYNSALWDW